MNKFTLFLLLFCGYSLHAQLTVENTLTPAQLTQTVLVGEGVTPFNIKFNGTAANAMSPRDQAGKFVTNFNGSNLGLDEGLVLTTGKCKFVESPPLPIASGGPGPANQWISGSSAGSDPDLAQLSGQSINNSVTLEFDFVATGLELNFDFVFASKEYPEYINGVNDSFGFFLSGPGISGPYSNSSANIALVPNTTMPVSIDNVNNGYLNDGNPAPTDNSQYYFNNSNIGVNPNTSSDYTVNYDGFTVGLVARATLQCGQTYHIKLALGNAQDPLFDSAVFLKNFRIKPLVLLANGQALAVCEGVEIPLAPAEPLPSTFHYVWTYNSVVVSNDQVYNLPPGSPSGIYTLTYYTAAGPTGCMLGTADFDLQYIPNVLQEPDPINICSPSALPYFMGDINPTLEILNGDPDFFYDIHYYYTEAEAYAPVAAPGISISELQAYTLTNNNVTIWGRFEDLASSGCIIVKSLEITYSTNPSGTFSYPGAPYCATLGEQPISSSVTPGGTYTSAPPGLNIDAVTGKITPSASTPGNYTVSYFLAASGNCPPFAPAGVLVSVVPLPAAPTVGTTAPSCSNINGEITISAPVGPNVEYSVDNGTTYQAGTLFSGLLAGGTYDVTVRNILTGCVSPLTQVVIGPALQIPAAPTATTTVQPNCITPTGTIEVSAPIGANLEYTIDGGITYQSATTFANLLPNAAYTLAVRDVGNTCVSANTIVSVNPIPTNPADPVLAITQPTCTTPTATIVVNSPTGVNLEYSIDGGATYNTAATFAGLAPNVNYSILVRNSVTGCVSNATVGTVDPIPANPPMPTALATQPNCTTATGSFVINTPTGPNYQYSNDGGITYQASASFTGLAAAMTYHPIVKNTVTGCVSAQGTVVIQPALNVPLAPTMSVTVQPTCLSPTGTIEVTAPTGINLSYSINGGTSFQPGTTFAGLAPNATYQVFVKDNVSGCVSMASSAAVNPIPNGPAPPVAAVTVQPTCSTPTGTIVISAPVGINFEYSINGGTTYQAAANFASLAPNATYSLTVRNTVTGCVSAPTAVVVNPIPANPAPPTATISHQPTCADPMGEIQITAPIGAQFEYSIDGGITYQSQPLFGSLAANSNYSINVRNIATGCFSTPTTFTINIAPTVPATPIASAANVCVGEPISLSTPAVSGASYSWTGPNGFVSSDQNPVIQNADISMSGSYSVIISTTADCPSLPGSVSVVVNPLPQPSLAQTGYICYNSITNVGDSYDLNTGLDNATYDFQWFENSSGSFLPIPLETQSIYTVTVPGSYAVQATNTTTGCVSAMVTATVNMSSPPLQVVAVSSEYFADIQSITINVEPAGDYEYQLDNGAFQSSNVFNDVLPGDHDVKVRNKCGERSTIAYLLDFPRFFTPNGDGYNDTWNIFALSSQANAKIYIFDRYGKLIKQIKPSGTGWDGSLNERLLPGTDYWFTVEYEENTVRKEFKSHFALKR